MPFLELFDETLDINSTENYELSLQAGPDGLLFCLLDTIRNKFVLIRSSEPDDNKFFTPGQINDIVLKDDFLNRHFKKVNLLMPSQKFTLIPSPLFDPARQDEYLKFNHIFDDDSIIISNKLSFPDVYIVFAVSKPIFEHLSGFHQKVMPFHQLKPLMQYISQSGKSINGNYIHVHLERDYFNLIIFESSSLKLCNAFYYKNINDILYYVMNSFGNLGLKQEETIHFSGLTDKHQGISSDFAKYVRNVRFADPSGNFTFSYVFNETSLHRYLNLFTAARCE